MSEALIVAGFLAGAIAAASEILVLAPPDRPLSPTERSLRTIAAAYVGGLAVLGVVLGILSSLVRPVGEPSSLVAAISATAIVAGALGIAVAWRGRPIADRPELQQPLRTLLVVRFSSFEALGVLGFLLGVLPLFLR